MDATGNALAIDGRETSAGDIVVEIAEWKSAEVRAAAMQQAMASGAYAPLGDLLAAPFRATVIRKLP